MNRYKRAIDFNRKIEVLCNVGAKMLDCNEKESEIFKDKLTLIMKKSRKRVQQIESEIIIYELLAATAFTNICYLIFLFIK